MAHLEQALKSLTQPVAEVPVEQPAEVTPTVDEVVEIPQEGVASDSPAAPEAAE